jgi:signal transduction histidine kinase
MIMQAVGSRFRRTSGADGTTVTVTLPLTEHEVAGVGRATERAR